MAKVKLDYEAVRYVAAKALYENDKFYKELVQAVTYKKYGVGYVELISNPYKRVQDSARALSNISRILSDCYGDDWYRVVTHTNGIIAILGKLKGYSSVDVEVYKVHDDSLLLNIFRNTEIRYMSNRK